MFKALRKNFNATLLFRAAVTYVAMVFLNNAGDSDQPFAAGLLFAMLACGVDPLINSALYLGSFAIGFSFEKMVHSAATALVLYVIYGVFARKKHLGAGSFIFLPASLVPYVLIGGADEYINRIIATAVITVTGVCFIPCVRAIIKRSFRRPERHEALSLAFLYFCVWMGGIKYVGGDGYKAFAVMLMAGLAAVFSGGESCLIAFVLSLPHAACFKDGGLIAPYLLMGGVSYLLARRPKPLYVGMMIAAELSSAYLFGWYGSGYGYVNLAYPAAALIVFAFIPMKLFRWAEGKLALSSSRPLTRFGINRTRTVVSGRLYEISGTFRELSQLFTTFNGAEGEFVYEDAILDEVAKVCEGCSLSAKCRASGFPAREDVIRLIAIAKGKGKLTAVDLPKKITQRCTQTGKLLFAVNKYVGLYAAEMERRAATEQTRQIVSLQAEGVAYALKGMAKNLAKPLLYRNECEGKLCALLLKRGVNVQELTVYGENGEEEISLVSPTGSSVDSAIPAISEFFSAQYLLSERLDIDGGQTVFVFERACPYDCVFGVASVRKNGEAACGDTHTLIKLTREKFMLALSDGMGSGEGARETSSSVLSLIECLYRTQVPSEVALGTVNRLLSVSGAENFVALDLAVINLDTLQCDFVKFGAPYGFVLTKGSVKLIEGSSLPLGIIDELKPSVCSEALSPGDVILFMSDGVTDAFGSSTDFADFLTAVSSANPQKLADKILGEALGLSSNSAGDDMTVVACKIFER